VSSAQVCRRDFGEQTGGGSGAFLEGLAYIAGLDDVAVMGEVIEERCHRTGSAVSEPLID
jgi:hypothetical protein